MGGYQRGDVVRIVGIADARKVTQDRAYLVRGGWSVFDDLQVEREW